MKYTYTIEYRLDDIEDYDNTEYIDEIPNKKEVNKKVKELKKEYGDRLVMLDVCKYDDDYLVDAETII